MTRSRLLTLMGSGETAPTMMKVHRDLVARVADPKTVKAVVLDTPYGFQENAPELAERAVEYFRKSVGVALEVAGLQRMDESADTVEVERGLARVRGADYVFAGPGSPTYCLTQWAGTALGDLLRAKLRTGGAVTFASAAALTMGRYTVPVYEIYKCGDEPTWRNGLDVLGEFGLDVAVIPHYDNTEGGHHDTRFCYLGERRLRILEAQMDRSHHVIGLDEHTGVTLDFDAETATVVGNGQLTIRVHGESMTHAAGTVLPIDELRRPGSAGASSVEAGVARLPAPTDASSVPTLTSLGAETERAEAAFDASMGARDAAGASRAALELEQAIADWSADTLQSSEGDRARAALRTMIVRLGDAAVAGVRDPRSAAAPFMDVLLQLRGQVRADKRYDLSDLIRDRLDEIGVEVRDTREGVEWVLRPAD